MNALVPGHEDRPPYCSSVRDRQLRCCSCGNLETCRIAARSYHPGGVNCGLADGSTTFVIETIDPETWLRALAIRDGLPVTIP